jgi:hypothetical protein
MPHCPPLIVNDFNLAHFDKMARGLASMGFAINAHSGEVSEGSFGFSWHFDPEREVLRIQCTRRPILIPCETIAAKIQKLLNTQD